jgi:hypothetical protein
MLTIFETTLFTSQWPSYWTEGERGEFAAYLAENPLEGAVIPGSGGARKIRWGMSGSGKRGGVRVIYYNRLANGHIWLLVMYSKSARENIPTHILKTIRETIENATH